MRVNIRPGIYVFIRPVIEYNIMWLTGIVFTNHLTILSLHITLGLEDMLLLFLNGTLHFSKLNYFDFDVFADKRDVSHQKHHS